MHTYHNLSTEPATRSTERVACLPYKIYVESAADMIAKYT